MRNNPQRWLVVALGLTLAAPAFAKSPRVGGCATVLSQNMGSQSDGVISGPFLGGAISVPLRSRYSVVEVSTGAYRLRLLEESGRTVYGLIVLPVNQPVAYTIEDRWFVVRDYEHHRHKFQIIGIVALQGAGQQPLPPDILVTR